MNFKKIYISILLSLSWCSYIHATHALNSQNQILLDLNSLLPNTIDSNPWHEQLTLPEHSESVADLVFHQGIARITSKSEHDFKLVKLPKNFILKALIVDIKGSFVVLPALNIESQIILGVSKNTILHNGFKINDQKAGAALLKGGSFELRANNSTKNLEIHAELVTNNGKIMAAKTKWQSKTTQNNGLIEISNILNLKGHKWINSKNGIVKVGEYLQSNHVHYIDDGLTEVMGLALINAETGRINSQFKLRNGIFRFKDNLSLSKDAKLYAENHLMLHSDKNINFDGHAWVEHQKSWPPVNYPQEIKALVQKLSPAVIISAKQDLLKNGTIVSKNTSITYSAQGKYHGRSGVSRSGFFDNNLQLNAAEIFIHDQFKAFNNLFFKGNNLTVDKLGLIDSEEQTYADLEKTFCNHGTMTSKNHLLKSGYTFDNTGNINSDNNLSIDTAWYSNRSGANITAKNATINADYAALNFLANCSAQNLEINTLANLNILGREAGSESLTINSPLLNANIGGLYQSNNFTSNSLINLNRFGAITRSLPSTSWDYKDVLDIGLSLAHSALANPVTHAVSSAYSIASSAYSVANGVTSFINDVPDIMRMSRIAKKIGQATKIAFSASKLNNQANNFSSELPEDTKPMSLWEAGKNTASQHLGGTAIINSVVDSDHGINFTGQRIKRNIYNSDNSNSYVLTNTILTSGGEENSYLRAYKSSTFSYGDYTIGGNKSVYDEYSVRSLGDTTITENTKIDADNLAIINPQGLLSVGENTKLHGNTEARLEGQEIKTAQNSLISGNEVFALSEKDINFQGDTHAIEKAVIQANNNIELSENSKVSSKNNTILAGGDAKVLGETAGKTHIQSGENFLLGNKAHVHGDLTVLSKGNADVNGRVDGFTKAIISSEKNLTLGKNSTISGEDTFLQGLNVTALGDIQQTPRSAEGTTKLHIQTNNDLATGKESHINCGELVMLSNGDAQIKGDINSTDIILVKSEGFLRVNEKSSMTGKAVILCGKGTAIEGTINGLDIISISSPKEWIYIESTAKINSPQITIEACSVMLDPGYSISGKELEITSDTFGLSNGNETRSIDNLITQTGIFEGFHITDTLVFNTDGLLRFTRSCASASENFGLNTSSGSIVVEPNVTLSAPGILKLYATGTGGKIRFDAGSSAKAGIFLDINAQDEFYCDYSTQSIPRKGKARNGSEGHTFNGVSLNGGSGLNYIYTDPDTGDTSERMMGLRVQAGKVVGTAVSMTAEGDMHIKGTKEVLNAGIAPQFTGIHYRKNDWWFDTGTSFFVGEYSTPGKIIIESPEGDYTHGAAKIYVGEGADICTHDTVNLNSLKGTQSRKKNSNEVEDVSVIVNLGDSTVRLHSCNGDVNARGLCYYGPKGTLSIKAINILLDRNILENNFSSSGWKPSIDYSVFSQWKSFTALQASKDFIKAINNGNFGSGFANALNPSITFGLNHLTTSGTFQTLGNSEIVTKNLILNAENTINQNNAFAIRVLGDADISAEDFIQRGADLHSRIITKSKGVFLSISLKGISVGVRADASDTSSIHWVPATVQVLGTLNFGVSNMQQIATTVDANKTTGHINNFSSETKQDTSKTINLGGSVGVNVTWAGTVTPSVGFNAGITASRESTHTSGITSGEGSTLQIGRANLKGAELSGVRADTVHSRSLRSEYRDRGTHVGIQISGGENPQSTITAGVSNNGHELNLSVDLSGKETQQENIQLFDYVGTISYENKNKGIAVTAPIITNINKDAFTEFSHDIKDLTHKITKVLAPQQKALPKLERPEIIDIIPSKPAYDAHEEVFSKQDTTETEATEKNVGGIKPLLVSYEIEETLAFILADFITQGIQPELEILGIPMEFRLTGISETQKFGFRIRGTNLYFQSADQFGEILATVKQLESAPSPFGRRAILGLNKSTEGVYFYKSQSTPFGDIGNAAPRSKYILVATENQSSTILQTTVHEGNHIGIKGSAEIPGDPKKLLEEFGKDFKAHVEKPCAKPQTALANMFNGPWEYFEINFRNALANLSLTIEEHFALILEYDSLLQQCRESIIAGKVPTFDGHPHASVLNKAAQSATNEMLCEVAPFLGEAGIDSIEAFEAMKKAAPNTYAYLKEVHLKTPWYQKPAVKNTAVGALILADLGVHIWQAHRQGLPMPKAIAEGGVRTVADGIVNIPPFTLIMLFFGEPVGWELAICSVVAGFVKPEALARQIEEKYTRAHSIMTKGGNPINNILASEDAWDAAAVLGSVQNMQAFSEALNRVSESLNDWFNQKFPEVKPAIAQAVREIWEYRKHPDRDEKPTWMLEAL